MILKTLTEIKNRVMLIVTENFTECDLDISIGINNCNGNELDKLQLILTYKTVTVGGTFDESELTTPEFIDEVIKVFSLTYHSKLGELNGN